MRYVSLSCWRRALAAGTAAAAGLAGDARTAARRFIEACQDCHSLDKNDVGPRHRGVFGRKAGSLPDYDYSDALKSANIVWNEETLDKWLTDPQAVAPGAKMFFHLGRRAGPRRRDRVPQRAREVRRAGRRGAPREPRIAEQRFREIVPPLLDDAYSLAKWLSQNAADAEDIVQDAALRALQALETVVGRSTEPWFLAIVRNAAMTWMARNRPKDLAYAGDMADLDALDSRQGGEARPIPSRRSSRSKTASDCVEAIAALPSPFSRRW